jgi:hypothetical protein
MIGRPRLAAGSHLIWIPRVLLHRDPLEGNYCGGCWF